MRNLIIVILLLASPYLYAQNQLTFEQILEDAKNGYTYAYAWMGKLYFEGEKVARNYHEAIKWFKKAVDNGDTSAYGWLGQCYYNQQNYQEAIVWLKKAIDSGDISAYRGVGMCYYEQKNYQEAIVWLKKAIDNGNTSAYGWLGQCYYNQQNYQEAIAWFKKDIDNNGNTGAYSGLAVCYINLQNYQEAIVWLKKAIDSGDTSAYVGLGQCYYEQKNYQEAIVWLKKAIDSGDTKAYGGLGRCYYEQKNYQEAIVWLKKAIDNGNTKAYGGLVQCYYNLQNYQEAIVWLKKAIDSGDTSAYVGLGQCYYEQKNYQEAIVWLKKAIDSGDTMAYDWLGECYINLQNYQEAIVWLKKAIDNGDTSAYGELGMCYYKQKNYQEAIVWLKKAVDNGDTVAYGWLGMCYYEQQNYQEAIKWSKKAIDNGYNLGYRILALLSMYGLGVPQNKDEAFELIAKAIDAAKQTGGFMPNILDAEGELYLADNNISKAREIYNAILKETPDFYAKQETKLSKFMKEYKDCDVDWAIPMANNISNHTFAVIISNEKYQMEKPVQYAENDGKIFAEYCKKTLGLPEKNVHFITDATLNNIKHEIKWLQDVIAVYKGDAKVIFYYAGHGIPDEQNKSAYLLPVDGYGSDVTTGYALEDLYRALGSLPSKSVIVFLDACFSGAKRDGDMLASARGVAIKVKQSNPTGNMVVFTAAQGDETAYPYKEEGHGLFTYYLLKKLQETKGNVTLGELGDYIKTQVERQSIVTNGKLQSPSILPASSIGNSWKEWILNK